MADDSGLGKTIKSGLIVHELWIRNGRGDDRRSGTLHLDLHLGRRERDARRECHKGTRRPHTSPA